MKTFLTVIAFFVASITSVAANPIEDFVKSPVVMFTLGCPIILDLEGQPQEQVDLATEAATRFVNNSEMTPIFVAQGIFNYSDWERSEREAFAQSWQMDPLPRDKVVGVFKICESIMDVHGVLELAR